MIIKFSENGTKLFVLTKKNEICILRTLFDGFDEYEIIFTHTDPEQKIITSFDINNDGSVLVIGFKCGKVQIWNILDDGTKIRLVAVATLNDHKNIVNSIKFHPTQHLFLTGSNDGLARLYEYQLSPEYSARCTRYFKPIHKKSDETKILSLAFNEDGSMIIIGDNKNTVTFYELDVSGKHYTSTFRDHSGSIKCMRLCHNRNLAVASGSQVIIYKKETVGFRKDVQKLRVMCDVNAVDCHHLFTMICVSSFAAGCVKIYYPSSPESPCYDNEIIFNGFHIENVMFHPTERILVLYSYKDLMLYFYRISDEHTIHRIFEISL
jgi:WD40 repeat protein